MILSTISCQNQQEVKYIILENDSLCILQEKKALVDFHKKKLKLSAENITGSIYDSLLFADFQIETYRESNRENFIMACYEKRMDSLLTSKYGQNITLDSFYKSHKIEYFNLTGTSPESLTVIDFGEPLVELHLIHFLRLNSNHSKYEGRRDSIKQLLMNAGLSPKNINLKFKVDTNGLVSAVYSNHPVESKLKKNIMDEMNRHGAIGIFEMDNKKKSFILPPLNYD